MRKRRKRKRRRKRKMLMMKRSSTRRKKRRQRRSLSFRKKANITELEFRGDTWQLLTRSVSSPDSQLGEVIQWRKEEEF